MKKLSVHPAESLTHENLLKTLNYIIYVLGVTPSTVHFFDESSVVKTIPSAAVRVNRCLRKSPTVNPCTIS